MHKYYYEIGHRFKGCEIIDSRKSKNGLNYVYTCECICGNIFNRSGFFINKLSSFNSCGCIHSSIAKNNKYAWTGVGEISGNFWAKITRNARNRNLELTLTKEEAWQMFLDQDRKCKLSGVELFFVKRDGSTASLDRIDSSKGYYKENCQWIHKYINIIKMSLTDNELVNWAHLATDFRVARPIRS